MSGSFCSLLRRETFRKGAKVTSKTDVPSYYKDKVTKTDRSDLRSENRHPWFRSSEA